MQQQQLAMQH